MQLVNFQRHFPLMRAVAFATLAGAALAGCGSGASVQSLPGGPPPSASDYTGPAPATSDVQLFMTELWNNVRPDARCGACHGVNQLPMFARTDDVNLAYEAANTVVDLSSPVDSRMVVKVAGGHHCWLGSDAASNQACATTMTRWITNWATNAGSGGGRQIQLKAPAIKAVGTSRNFPSDPAIFASTVYPVLQEYCTTCHSASAAMPQQPFFADPDINVAYAAVRPKINLDSPASSRLVVRLRDEFHNCWSDCAANAAEMQAAIEAFQAQVPLTQVDSSLVISKALTMYDGTVASGGNRYENSQVALWEFKEGQGATAFDTSGVDPAINLTLSGDVTWVGGWGIQVNAGKAQGSTASSKKLYNLIKATGEYSIEAWVAPGNVTQEDARIVSYSAGTTVRNFTMGQTMYDYDFFHRSSTTDADGQPKLHTADAKQSLQATLQHVVMTFDAVNGRRIYVNGEYTGDADPAAGGNLGDWDDTFALVLGNEVSGDKQWKGTIRMAAIHNRALTPAQIQQNFQVGVGEKFFLLFAVDNLVGIPNAFILFEVSQFDSYGYLFNKPTFLILDANAQPGTIPIKGLRIGVNGVEAAVGQAYANLDISVTNANYPATGGQLLSNLGTVVQLEKGPADDLFFLSFEVIGSNSNVRTEAAPLTPPPPPDGVPQSDVGMRTFDEINATMSQTTGVSTQNPSVKATFSTVKQQLPTVETIQGFLASHQIAVAQLAIEYCNALVDDTTLRASYFPGFDFSAPANQAFNTQVKLDQVLDPLINNALGTNLPSQPDVADVKGELGSLVTTLTSCGASCGANRTPTVVKSVCASTLGSGAMLVQ